MIVNCETKKVVGGATLTGYMMKGALAIVKVIYKIVTDIMKKRIK